MASPEEATARETLTTSRGTFTFVKYFDASDTLRRAAFDSSGREVSWRDAVDVDTAPVIDDGLRSKLDDPSRPDVLPVEIALRGSDVPGALPTEHTDAVDHARDLYFIDDEPMTRAEYDTHALRIELQAAAERASRVLHKASAIRTLAEREGWKLDQQTLAAWEQASSPQVLLMEAGDIESFAERNSDLIGALGYHVESVGDDTMATAMQAVRADYAINNVNHTGSGIGVYMTESGCAPSSYMTNYTRLSGSDTNHHRTTSAVLRAMAPNAYIYCRGSSTLPTASDLSNPGPGGNPQIRLVSHSRTPNGGSTYDTLAKTWDDFIYANNVLVVNSAGNSSADPSDCTTGYVKSPARGLNVLAVGNYNDSNNTIASTSCYKDPTDIQNIKPELSAPGQNLSPAGTSMTGTTLSCSGTSCSTPLIAGLAADLLQGFSVLQGRAARLKAILMMGALDAISGGFDKVGYGGFDYYDTYQTSFTQYWSGSHATWATWDSADPYPGNGDLDRVFTVPSASISKFRVVIAWLTRGQWTYEHRNDTFPLGLDFDIVVYRPDGQSVGLNQTWRDGFAVVDFDPAVSGTYRARISRVDHPDASNEIRLALALGYVP